MAIDKKLQIFDDEGNPVDYDILASDVKFEPDGKDLPTKLNEMQDAIDEAASQGGIQQETDPTVPAWAKRPNPPTPQEIGAVPTQGYVPLTQSEKDKLDNLPTADQLTTQLGEKANSNEVVKSITVNGQAAPKDQNGNVNIEVEGGEQVSVIQPANPDGTFIIRVGSTDYTVNLNHTHEEMVKLEKYTEATMPQTKDDDTIYVQVDDVTTPQAIEALYIFGLEFTGGVPDTGMPMIKKPIVLRPLNLGVNDGSGVTALVDVQAKNLNYNGSTDGLTVSVGQNSGLLLSYGQTSDATSITIPQLDAETGCQITVKYTGSGALNDGALVFSHDNAMLASVVVVVESLVRLSAVKLTGTQWMQTDYYPNPNTRFEFDCKFIKNTYSSTGTGSNSGFFLMCKDTSASSVFCFNNGQYFSGQTGNQVFSIYAWVEHPYTNNGPIYNHVYLNEQAFCQRGVMSYSNGSISFLGSTWTTETRTSVSDHPLCIGYNPNNGGIYGNFDLEIYELKIYNGTTLVYDFKPVSKNGIAGLFDDASGTFLSSETAKTSGLASDELVAIPLT